MAKDNRIILRAPRIHGRLVKDEDEIEELLSPEQGQRLLDSGALVGDWNFQAVGEEPKQTTDKPSGDTAGNGNLLAQIKTLQTENEKLAARLSELETLRPKNEPLAVFNLPPRAVNELKAAGLDTPAKINAATDQQLLPIWGINEINLPHIREIAGAQ